MHRINYYVVYRINAVAMTYCTALESPGFMMTAWETIVRYTFHRRITIRHNGTEMESFGETKILRPCINGLISPKMSVTIIVIKQPPVNVVMTFTH